MRFTVVSTSEVNADIATAFLPQTDRVAVVAGRIYLFYALDVGRSCSFHDIQGESLIEAHAFETLAEADAWVSENAHQHQLLLAAEGRVQ